MPLKNLITFRRTLDFHFNVCENNTDDDATLSKKKESFQVIQLRHFS